MAHIVTLQTTVDAQEGPRVRRVAAKTVLHADSSMPCNACSVLGSVEPMQTPYMPTSVDMS